MRCALKYILRALPGDDNKLIGAEIGVREGKNALDMLRSMNMKKLYLIDHFRPYYEDSGLHVTQEQQDRFYENLLKNIEAYPQAEVYKQASSEARARFPNNFFDFVYIDAGHTYEEVFNDLKIWLPKVKKNRYLCGHDFNNKQTPEVANAVKDFCKENNLILYQLDDIDWLTIKTQEDKTMRNRAEILAEQINRYKYRTYVEIGVSKGDTARYILNNCPSLEKIYLIDPDPNEVFCGGWFTDPKVEFIKAKSYEVADRIPEVDMIFIDGDHAYKSVKQDLELYGSKVAMDGILCGHDYQLHATDPVRRAVDEFFGGGNFFTEQDDNDVFVWWKRRTTFFWKV